MTIMRCKWWHHNVPYCHLRCLVSGSNFKSMVISFLASWEMCLQYLGSNWYMPWHPQNQHLQLQVDDTKTENPKEPEKGWRQKGRISGHHLKNITMIQDTMTMQTSLTNSLTSSKSTHVNTITMPPVRHPHHAGKGTLTDFAENLLICLSIKGRVSTLVERLLAGTRLVTAHRGHAELSKFHTQLTFRYPQTGNEDSNPNIKLSNRYQHAQSAFMLFLFSIRGHSAQLYGLPNSKQRGT